MIESPLEAEAFFNEMEVLNSKRFDKTFTQPGFYQLRANIDPSKDYSYYNYHEFISDSQDMVSIGSGGDFGLGFDSDLRLVDIKNVTD